MARLQMLPSVVLITALAGSAYGEDDNAEQALPLKGKVVLLQSPAHASGHLLEDASLVEIGGRFMVVGRQIALDDSPQAQWTEGLKTAVAWDAVEFMAIFDSLDDYRKRSKLALSLSAPKTGASTSPDSGRSKTAERPLDPRIIQFAKGLVDKYDTNGDGALQSDEWKRISANYADADTDGDGNISVEEVAARIGRR